MPTIHLCAFGVTEQCRKIRKFGEHCLSRASCAAAGFFEPRRKSEGPRRARMVLGPFAETKMTSDAGTNPGKINHAILISSAMAPLTPSNIWWGLAVPYM